LGEDKSDSFHLRSKHSLCSFLESQYQNISIPGTTRRQCNEVPKGALGGFFGLTEEKCFDIEIPETNIESALIGGGKSQIYLLPSDLEDGTLSLEVETLPTPSSLETLQSNYQLFETLNVGVAV